MKNLIAVISLTLFAGAALASQPSDCLKTVMKSPELMTEMKKMYERNVFFMEKRASDLCTGTTDAAATVACYREAMTDAEILPATKERFATTPFKIEEAAIDLCRP